MSVRSVSFRRREVTSATHLLRGWPLLPSSLPPDHAYMNEFGAASAAGEKAQGVVSAELLRPSRDLRLQLSSPPSTSCLSPHPHNNPTEEALGQPGGRGPEREPDPPVALLASEELRPATISQHTQNRPWVPAPPISSVIPGKCCWCLCPIQRLGSGSKHTWRGTHQSHIASVPSGWRGEVGPGSTAGPPGAVQTPHGPGGTPGQSNQTFWVWEPVPSFCCVVFSLS